MFRTNPLMLGVAVLALGATPASAQQQKQPPDAATKQQAQPQQQRPAQQQPQPEARQQQTRPQQEDSQRLAQECFQQIQTLHQRMNEEGYWIAGWGSRWGISGQPGYGVAPPGPGIRQQPPVTGAPPARTAPGTTTRAPAATAEQRAARAPWGEPRYGVTAPRYQIRVLTAAANVLAHRGDSQGCQAVVAELRDAYDSFVRQLKQAGIEPGEVVTWRTERVLQAKPVAQLGQPLSVSDITGTEIRNRQDEQLGTVDDVILDPDTGEISYVLVERGGFLGIGSDYVAIPWESLQATPGLNLLVLDMTEQQFEQAPTVDPNGLSQPGAFAEARRRIDEFWNDPAAGGQRQSGSKPQGQKSQPPRQ